jgi:uncharacterized protein (TIGR03435 family)
MTGARTAVLTGAASIAAALLVQAAPIRAAQAPAAPRFEVASIRENTSGDPRPQGMRTQAGGRFAATNILLKDVIAIVFRMADPDAMIGERILGGPEWIGSTRVNIEARAATPFEPSPDGASPELLAMIRSLLEDQLNMRVHRETRELSYYELVRARADGRLGPELRPSPNCDAVMAAVRAGGGIPPRQPGEPPPCGATGGPARIIAGGLPMDRLANMLAGAIEGAGLGARLIVDKTGLDGRYAFTLAWTPERTPAAVPAAGVAPVDPNGPSLFTALQEQLGLKLQSVKGPLDVVVIDGIDRPSRD